MTARTRTDIHRPSSESFDPEDYDLLGVFDLHPDAIWDRKAKFEAVRAAVDRGYKFAPHQEGAGKCGHCGAYIRYAALMQHRPSREMIYIGEICLDHRFIDLTKSEFQRLRKLAQLDRQKQRVKQAYLALCDKHPVVAYASYAGNIMESAEYYGRALSIMSDLSHKARIYGDLSQAQIDLLGKLMAQLEKQDTERVARVEEPKNPVPVGRLVIEGEVVSVKWVESAYGSSLKMLLKGDGWRVWGTAPKSLWNPQRGDKVRLTATVKASDDDESFGFFSRPTKGEFLSRTEEE